LERGPTVSAHAPEIISNDSSNSSSSSSSSPSSDCKKLPFPRLVRRGSKDSNGSGSSHNSNSTGPKVRCWRDRQPDQTSVNVDFAKQKEASSQCEVIVVREADLQRYGADLVKLRMCDLPKLDEVAAPQQQQQLSDQKKVLEQKEEGSKRSRRLQTEACDPRSRFGSPEEPRAEVVNGGAGNQLRLPPKPRPIADKTCPRRWRSQSVDGHRRKKFGAESESDCTKKMPEELRNWLQEIDASIGGRRSSAGATLCMLEDKESGASAAIPSISRVLLDDAQATPPLSLTYYERRQPHAPSAPRSRSGRPSRQIPLGSIWNPMPSLWQGGMPHEARCAPKKYK